MSNRPKTITWKADPHTITMIEIVSKYLYRWALITGTKFPGKPLTYIDGFAGPGEYTNHIEGSPLAALKALNDAQSAAGNRWVASFVRALFIEQDPARKANLERIIAARNVAGNVKFRVHEADFEQGLVHAESTLHKAFFTSAPLVVFIDPFGAKGFPWHAVERILSSKTSEIILNFDADGIARIARAGGRANADEILTTIFGDLSWKDSVNANREPRELARALLNLYKARLRSLPSVNYTFAFEMASAASVTDYYLLFASQHSKGLEKMKEAMREIDTSGRFRFSDADVGQDRLFNFDEPSDWVESFGRHFVGKGVKYSDVHDYVLNETPFINPSKLLYAAQEAGVLEVDCDPPRKRKNIFKPDEVKLIRFKGANNA